MADEVATAPRYPDYVVSEADRTRWDNAGVFAQQLLGEDATGENVWVWQRNIFHDRVTYPD